MLEGAETNNRQNRDSSTIKPTNYNSSKSSSISLPKGGGAIRGISEKFAANPVTGTSSFSIPLPVSPARGFQPELALSYDSGSGNSAFGLGWNVGVPSISRKTDKGLAQYEDYRDSDTYTLGGAEDLVPFLVEDDQVQAHRTFDAQLLGKTWEVKLYRPRIEGGYSKIERWRDTTTNKIWWRTVSSGNITTVYGLNDDACIFEPGNRAKTFRWLVDFTYDDKGHLTCYRYAQENDSGIDFSNSSESHRQGALFSQRYLKKVLYGLKDSWIKMGLSPEAIYEQSFTESDFHFQTVLDYGDHKSDYPISESVENSWPARNDPFSSYRTGFEVRTYRRCQRVLLFHHFPRELGADPELIQSLELEYANNQKGFSFLSSIRTVGYKRAEDGTWEEPAPFPAMTFKYQQHNWNKKLSKIASKNLINVPAGVDGQQYQWADLYGEGLSGILTEQAGTLYYKQNLGGGNFGVAHALSTSPSLKGLGQSWQLQDLESNGIKSLVSSNGISKGYYQFNTPFDNEFEWDNFIPFKDIPNIRFDDPNLRIIDLNGDGKPDILISEERAFRWYPSKGKEGYQSANFALQPEDDNASPSIIFANQSESIFTADMTGDGMTDIVRIRNGEVIYWPNMGFGKFGKSIRMSNAPHFNHPDLFTAGHIRLADIDGSGTTDIIYLGKNEFQYWLNNSGNSWSESVETINPFPDIDNLSTISVTDLLGTGTACIVWSSPLPAHHNQSIQYIDLMASKKPHLMKSYKNGFGKTVNLEYTPSTQFYLEDKAKGEPWITKLHFPVHCLSKTESIDQITGARFASMYSYHHGYYDHAEREFRGFGRVDQINTEDFEHFAKGGSSNVQDEEVLHQTPVLVKTWFHNGAYLDQERILNQYEQEYCYHNNEDYAHLQAFNLDQPKLPDDLTPAEWREALRACKGMALRTETYGLDGTEKEPYPFSIAYSTCSITKVQNKATNAYGVFQVQNTESISLSLDRNPSDPRISHNLLLKTDQYGQPILSAIVNYGRKLNDGPAEIIAEQKITQCVISEVEYTQDDYGLLGGHELEEITSALINPVAFKNTSFELGIEWQWGSNKFNIDALNTLFENTENNAVDYLRLEQQAGKDTDISRAAIEERRLLSCAETRFANSSLDGELPRGKINPQGIGWSSYQLAFTPELIERIYGDKVSSSSLEGGYVNLDGDNNWWVPSGHAIYHHPNQTTDIKDRFFMPYGAKDSLGAASWTESDDYLLLPTASSVSRVGFDDPSNRTTDAWYLQLNRSIVINDYRTLSPKFTKDVNDNWSGVETDTRGMVIKSAIMGKVPIADENTPPLPNAETEGDNLANPSAIMDYGFYNEETKQPAWAYSKTYTGYFSVSGETKEAIDRENDPLKFLQQYEYSDGSGNVVMAKVQAQPGVAKQLQDDGTVIDVDTKTLPAPHLRWIGNGRTIINNAGNPIKQYEPYFSVTHEYEDAAELVETGISPILFYDAAERNICTLNPNQTYTKVVFDAWQQQSWDVNDTLFLPQEDGTKITDISADPDVGHFFQTLNTEEYSPSWYEIRITGEKGETTEEKAQNKRAAEKTENHVATPSESHMDALGRTTYALAHNRLQDGTDERYKTLTNLDIEGNMLSVIDARDNAVMGYRYNMLPPPDEENPKPALYQNSMDGGEKWSLFDIQGKPLKSWDSRDHVFKNKYDGLHRPIESLVVENGTEKLISLSEYVDSDNTNVTDLLHKNLAGTVIASYDQSGRSQILASDFKGNILHSTKTLTSDYKNTIDWATDPEQQLEDEVFQSTSQYDALSRITYAESPNTEIIPASITRPTYNESGALDKMFASIRNAAEKKYVEKIEYDAKGQRQFIEYGNGVITTYKYEPDTYRLQQLTTVANNKKLQDSHYSYDSIGNITEIHDKAQSTICYNNMIVKPDHIYLYDPLYRLIEAIGREHATQANIPTLNNGWDALPCDDVALQKYIQTYQYDGVGNILKMAHRRPNDSNTGWTRNYDYETNNNRLKATTLGDPTQPYTDQYSYNTHGSMESMSHLSTMAWDFAEQLRHVDLAGGGHGYYVYESSGERTRKVIETNGSTIKDRIYLGGWEIYRERNAQGITLERESLHIMDDQQHIALVETKTIGETGAEGFEPNSRYQMGNHLGSVNFELDNNGEIISYEEFHPHGTTAYHAGARLVQISKKRYRYTGKERDEETGFSYHGVRYLISGISRWCSVDPAGLIDGPNIYQYVNNNPIIKSDPTGFFEESFHGGAIYNLALAAGYVEKDAAKIAIGSAYVDRDETTSPMNPSNWASGDAHEYHFLEWSKLETKLDEEFRDKCYLAIDLEQFGNLLHTVGDVGFEESPGPHRAVTGRDLSGMFFASRFPLISLLLIDDEAGEGENTNAPIMGYFFDIGHPTYITETGDLSWGANHATDQAHKNPEATRALMKNIFLLLKEVKANDLKYQGPETGLDIDSPELLSYIDRFVRADTGDKVMSTMYERNFGADNSYMEWLDKYKEEGKVHWSSQSPHMTSVPNPKSKPTVSREEINYFFTPYGQYNFWSRK